MDSLEDLEAAGGEKKEKLSISLKEKKLLEAFRALLIEPDIERPEDLVKLLKDMERKWSIKKD